MANFEVLSLDPTTPQIRAPGAGDGYSVPRDMTFATGTTLNAPTTVVSVNTATDALRITQVGSGNALKVEDSANPDATPTVIDATGAVGIGTASPAAKLDVVGTAQISSSLTLSGGTANGVLYLNGSKVATSGSALTFDGSTLTNTGNSTGTIFNTIVNTDAAGSSITDERIVFAMGGSLGFGVTGWANAGIVEAASTGGLYLGAFNGPINFASGASARNINMTLSAAGNLGIGTTSPGARVDVQSVNNAFNPLQVRYNTSNDAMGFGIANSNGFVYIGYNTKSQAGSDTPIYERSSFATQLRMDSGKFVFNIAGSGTAGNAITFTEVARLSSNVNGIFTVGNVGSVGGLGTDLGTIGAWGVNGGGFRIYRGSGAGTANSYFYGDSTQVIIAAQENIPMAFHTNATERARITAAGNVGIGTSSPAAKLDVSGTIQSTATGSAYAGYFNYVGATGQGVGISSTGVGSSYAMFFFNNGVSVGNIYLTSTTTTYNTSSDRRLKNNIAPSPSASNVIDAIEIVSHGWKAAPDKRVTYGVIAQDLAKVAPEAVTAGDDGEEVKQPWGVDYSKLVPMLIKEMQSLRKRVAELEAR